MDSLKAEVLEYMLLRYNKRIPLYELILHFKKGPNHNKKESIINILKHLEREQKVLERTYEPVKCRLVPFFRLRKDSDSVMAVYDMIKEVNKDKELLNSNYFKEINYNRGG